LKFNLIDKIEHLDDTKIVAIKSVSLAEEYLADHFPKFPVLPGVLMLEAVTQAAGWLMHHRTNFAKSMAVLKAARNVRYGTFVSPGNSLRVEIEFIKLTGSGAAFKASSTVNGDAAISGRIEIAYFDLGDRTGLRDVDERIKAHERARWDVLRIHSPVLI
jgi:3-hydroxyacyl-[acyl-carrier-protein] dehydratase